METEGCPKDPVTGMFMDPVTKLPIGSVILNSKGEYGILAGNGKILGPLSKKQVEEITGAPVPDGPFQKIQADSGSK